MEISGANAIITHVVEKEQCTVKRILSHRQHTDGSGAPTRGYDTGRSSYTAIGTGRIGAPVQTPIGNTIHVAIPREYMGSILCQTPGFPIQCHCTGTT